MNPAQMVMVGSSFNIFFLFITFLIIANRLDGGHVEETDVEFMFRETKHHNHADHKENAKGNIWKDAWILDWEIRTKKSMKSIGDAQSCKFNKKADCKWLLPKYLPPRKSSNRNQLIPKVIWQTWKSDVAAGEKHYDAVMSYIENNPEYEFYLFDDDDATSFLCAFYPQAATIFQLLVPGAPKADIWRLAVCMCNINVTLFFTSRTLLLFTQVVHHYGGVYVDTDSGSILPFREFIWPNASVVSGIDRLGELHQWAIIFAPNHPFLSSSLHLAVRRATQLYLSKSGGSVLKVTGPETFMQAITHVMKINNCYNWLKDVKKKETEMADDLVDHFCSPSVGVLEVFTAGLSSKIAFKMPGVGGIGGEMYNKTHYYMITERKWDTLFRPLPVHVLEDRVHVGNCSIRDPQAVLFAKLIHSD